MTTHETKPTGIRITVRDIGTIITFLVLIAGVITKFERQQVQIEQIRTDMDKYPPAVMYTNQTNMAKDIQEIKTDMKTLVSVMNDFIKENK